MNYHIGGQLHYRACFDVSSKDGSLATWPDLIRTVRRWISDKLGYPKELVGPWFFNKGSCKPGKQPGYYVQTACALGNGTVDKPGYWAVRLVEPDKEVNQRRWQTDIGLKLLESGAVRIMITISYFLRHDYIGEEPERPSSSTPNIVKNILSSPKWKAFIGGDDISTQPIALKTGQVPEFERRLRAEDRILPMVLITIDKVTGEWRIDAERLSGWLAGGAIVYKTASPAVEDELNEFLPRKLQCYGGMVRIYQPHVRYKPVNDAIRHRFFTVPNIEESGSDGIEGMIISGIVRRGLIRIEGHVLDIDVVNRLEREQSIAELTQAATDRNDKKLSGLYATHVAELNESITKLQEKIEELEYKILENDESKEILNNTIKRLKHEIVAASESRDKFKMEAEAFRSRYDAICSLRKMPDNAIEVIDTIEQIHQGRIVFTDRAKKSARESTIKDVNVIWECLWSMATDLYDLYFSSTDRINLPRLYQSRTSFGLALTEGKKTRDNKKMMALRKDHWQGQVIDIEPHVKVGKDIRVHYCAHPKRKLIVVGHCGEHLESEGTRHHK